MQNFTMKKIAVKNGDNIKKIFFGRIDMKPQTRLIRDHVDILSGTRFTHTISILDNKVSRDRKTAASRYYKGMYVHCDKHCTNELLLLVPGRSSK